MCFRNIAVGIAYCSFGFIFTFDAKQVSLELFEKNTVPPKVN